MGRSVVSVIAVLASLQSAHALANDEIVVVYSGAERELSSVPAAVSVISGEAIDTTKAIRIGEVLARAPGVFFSGLNGPREIAQIRQPLAFDNRTLFLEDGVPLQSSVFFDQSAIAYSAALAAPGRIEVLRGPGGALYGSDAFSGVVHVVTKSAPEEFEAGLSARYGVFETIETIAEVGGPISDRHSVRLTGAFSGEEGFRDETAFHRGNAIFRHAFSDGAFSTDSTFVYAQYETESATAINFDEFLQRSRASGLSALVDPEAAIEEAKYIRLQTKLSYAVSDDLTLTATPYYRRQDSDATATFRPATTPRTNADVSTFGTLLRGFWSPSDNTQTTFGVDLEFTDFSRLTVQDAPDVVVFGSLFRQGVQFDYDVDYRAISPYWQGTHTFGAFQLDLGLRYDSLRYRFDNSLLEVPGDALFQAGDRTDRFDALSPKAALTWRASDSDNIYFRYARGFRIPRESDLYELEDGQTDFELDPERLNSYELGWRRTVTNFSFELAGYWAVSQDGIITDIQTAGGNISINAGSSRFAGVELSTTLELGAGFEVDGAFAFQDFRFRQRAADGPDPFDGNRISEAPRTIGNLILRWRPDFADEFLVETRLRHIGSWAMNDANTRFTDDEYIITMFGEWQIRENAKIHLKLENVADQNYAVFADAPVFRPNGRARPGQPRTLSGGFSLAF